MRAIVAVPFALLCAGCVSTNAAVLDSSVSYQKICPDGVQIFTSGGTLTPAGWIPENQLIFIAFVRTSAYLIVGRIFILAARPASSLALAASPLA